MRMWYNNHRFRLRENMFMKYNEKQFATSANKKATFMWVVMSAVLSAAYVIEIFKGLINFS